MTNHTGGVFGQKRLGALPMAAVIFLTLSPASANYAHMLSQDDGEDLSAMTVAAAKVLPSVTVSTASGENGQEMTVTAPPAHSFRISRTETVSNETNSLAMRERILVEFD